MNSLRGPLVFFVEDPGAANFAVPVVATMKARNLEVQVFAAGHARTYMDNRDISWLPLRPETIDDIFESVSPRLVIVGTAENPETIGLDLVVKARRHSIPSVGLVDAPGNAAFRFRGGGISPLHCAPDWIVVPDLNIRSRYVDLGFDVDRIAVTGHPHYDEVRSLARSLDDAGIALLRERLFADAGDRIVAVFAAEPSTGFHVEDYRHSDEYTLHGRGDSPWRTNIGIEEFLDALPTGLERPYLVLRLHPKSTADEVSGYLGEFDRISVDDRPLEVVAAADAVVGMSTMLLVEAVLMGRPTLSILPRAVEREWISTVDAGLTPVAMNRDDLFRLLPQVLAGSCLPEEDAIDAVLPSGALERVMGLLAGLAEVN